MYARPKSHFAQYINNCDGLSVLVTFSPGQKWKVTTSQGYYYLNKRGAFQLRLTYRIFHKLFDKVEG